MSPLITTIIPTFRRPDRLKKAIQSVLNQTYPHIQVCVYDNASGDSTSDVVKELAKSDPRVMYHCHLTNIGAVENFQYGLSRIETPFFSFLSDDDLFLPEFYETAMNALKKFPDASFFSGAVVDVSDDAEVIDIILSRWPENEYYSPPDGLLEMIGKYSNWAGVLFSKDVIKKIGLLDLSLKAIDVDYMLRAAACCPFVISKTPCAIFVQHLNSYSRINGLKLIWPGWSIMMSKVQENVHLSLETRKKVQLKLLRNLQKLLFMNALRSLEKKNFEETESIIEIFVQNKGRKTTALLLALAVKVCKAFSSVHALFLSLLNMRRFCLRRFRVAHTESEFIKNIRLMLSGR
ncbi:MAG: glycosyltransferase family 2 protein [Verrucomicrobia bacterium]|nr:glycosyltransferase family 2 protein [Verrucomicrobiota bacterium]